MKSIALMLALVVSAPVLAGGNPANGEKKAATCVACHGAKGASPIQADFPILAGQPADYLAKALHDYKNGGRKNAIMAGQAAPLTKQDIEDLSAYFAQQASPLHVKR